MAETFPIDSVPVNGWIMELPGMANPHITKVQGLNRKTGVMEVVDGGSNRKFFFSDGVLEHGPLTIMRTRDGSPEDAAFSNFFDSIIGTGAKIDGTLIQFRHGNQVLKIQFTGLLMNEQSLTDMDVDGGNAKSEMTAVAQCDLWVPDFDVVPA